MTERSQTTKSCTWKEEDGEAWATTCGNTFVLTCDTPDSHGMQFCCYCGKQLEVLTKEDEQHGVGA